MISMNVLLSSSGKSISFFVMITQFSLIIHQYIELVSSFLVTYLSVSISINQVIFVISLFRELDVILLQF